MICSNCGYDVPQGMHFCGVCGAQVTAQYQESQPSDFNNQQVNAQLGADYNQMNGAAFQQPAVNSDDQPDSVVNAMSFFYPIFGFILYFVDREKKPVKSKAALKWAIISAVCYVVFFALYFVAIFGFGVFAGIAEAGMMI